VPAATVQPTLMTVGVVCHFSMVVRWLSAVITEALVAVQVVFPPGMVMEEF